MRRVYRVQSAEEELFGSRAKDSMVFQEVGFEPFYVREGDGVVLEITGIYPGERYDDVALSELLPTGAH